MSDSDEPIVDPDLKEELEKVPAEDPFLTEYMTQGGGKQKESLRFIEKWFPGEDEWQGKTKIQSHQAHALAVMRNLDTAFPELEESIMNFIRGTFDDYEKYLTSIEGEARKEHVDILRTLFGGAQVDEAESRSEMMSMLANNLQQEDE